MQDASVDDSPEVATVTRGKARGAPQEPRPARFDGDELGRRLRAARIERGISLRSLAAEVGVSASLLSQVETGRSRPSVSTLYALVAQLEVSVDSLLRPEPTRLDLPEPARTVSLIQRREDAPRIDMQNGVTWERLVSGDLSSLDALISTHEPGGASAADGELMRHAGFEMGYLIEGELTLRIELETHVLRAGDSFSFQSTRPHLYVNHTDEVARGLWIVVHEPLTEPT